jgi:hypothetical protein
LSRGKVVDTVADVSSDSTSGPFFRQPDPSKPWWIVGKCERLERRGPHEFVIVGKTFDGRAAEARIVPLTFEMRGFE